MCFPLLALNILIGVVLVNYSAVIFASNMQIKAGKTGNSSLISVLEKSRKSSQRLSKGGNSVDIWERIRSQMQISKLSPMPVLPKQTVDLKNNNADKDIPAVVPAHKYLYKRLGFKNLLYKTDSRIVKAGVNNPLSSLKSKKLDQTPDSPVRFRTRIDVHPQSHQPAVEGTAEQSGQASLFNDPKLSSGIVNGQRPLFLKETKKTDEPGIVKQSQNYERVKKHVTWYSQHHDYLRLVAGRASPYLYHIVEALNKYKLPPELALLPIVESAYQPTAQSPKKAAGLWQFMPSTGLDFDLKQSAHYDERLDITASTKAAIRYLSFLKQHFKGDWLLALAAYNCGLGTVDEAINRNLAEGIEADYWSLRLPEETQQYVPRFLALSTIFANPAAYGLKIPPVRNEPYFINVTIDRKNDVDYLAEKDFSEIAKLADLDYEQFTRLNPGYIQSQLPTEGPFKFSMPVNNAKQLHKSLARIAQFLDKPTEASNNQPLAKNRQSVFTASSNASALVDKMVVASETGFSVIPNPFLLLDVN